MIGKKFFFEKNVGLKFLGVNFQSPLEALKWCYSEKNFISVALCRYSIETNISREIVVVIF